MKHELETLRRITTPAPQPKRESWFPAIVALLSVLFCLYLMRDTVVWAWNALTFW